MGDPARRTVRLDDLIFKATAALLIGPDYAAIMYVLTTLLMANILFCNATQDPTQ